MILIINGYKIDLKVGSAIKQNKQVNDIGDISTRQGNFTPSFDAPKTADNVKAMEYCSLVGNTSNVPYQKNECFLYDDSGIMLIYKGWAVIKDSTDTYKIHIYDGIIDFYKAIENRTLTEIGLSELNHLKNLDTVIETWTDLEIPYRYNVADYNGKMIYDIDKLNIDYLIPSASVPYLWDRLFEFIGWTYEGSVFNIEDFKNMSLSYPKTIGDDTQETEDVHVYDFNGAPSYFAGSDSFFGAFQFSNRLTHNPALNNAYATSSPAETNGPPAGTVVTIIQGGLYKFSFSGIVGMSPSSPYQGSIDIVMQRFVDGEAIYDVIASGIDGSQSVNATFYVNLPAGQSFQLYFTPTGQTYQLFGQNQVSGNMDIDMDNVTGNSVDFEEAFIGMGIKDFVNEILTRFSLTPFPDLFNKKITFLTVDELIQNDDIDDWTSKFKKRLTEEYITGSYARRNKLSMKYNEQDANHNDGYLYVNNVNLKDETTVFSSKIYSPEKIKTGILGRTYNVYKFWNKQVKDDGQVEYKPLDNRFYFMKSEIVNQTLNVGSEVFAADVTVSSFPVEDFTHMSMREIVNRYYPTIYAILNKSKEHKSLIDLNAIDIQDLDFKKPVFIEQESSYFLKNRIVNWEPGKLTTVELVKLSLEQNQSDVVAPSPSIIIYPEAIPPNDPFTFNWSIFTNYSFLDYVPESATIYATQLDGPPWFGGTAPTGLVYSEALDLDQNANTIDLPFPLDGEEGWYEVKIVDDNFDPDLVSNIAYVFIGNSDIVSPNIEVSFEQLGYGVFPRDLYYRFNNFTPITATLAVRPYNFITNEVSGPPVTMNLIDLTQDVDHTIDDFPFPSSFGFYKVTLTTDTLILDNVMFAS